MKYEDEVFSKESVKARKNNKRETRNKFLKSEIENNKQKRRSEIVTVILFTIIVVTFVSLSVINICGL
jgi:hypothetical protein